jgi:hypothetical protein
VGKFYISAPVDEIALAQEVQPLVSGLHGMLPSSDYLRQLSQERGLAIATMALYEAVRQADANRAFIDTLDAHSLALTSAPRAEGHSAGKVLIIPALFHGHYPETGADAALPASIAQAHGFEVETIPIKSVGTVTENANIIARFMESEKSAPLWVFAVSKGSADFRAFLHLHPEMPAISSIAGWINVCGLANGCHITDYNMATPWRRLKYRLACRLFGADAALMQEMQTTHPYWSTSAGPSSIRRINFMAIPLPSHVQKSLIGRYMAISRLGPNDGMVLCRDALMEPGVTYPVLGCDHFFRGPQIAPLLHRFFSWLAAPGSWQNNPP